MVSAPFLSKSESSGPAPFLQPLSSGDSSSTVDVQTGAPSIIDQAMGAATSLPQLQPMRAENSLPVSQATGDPATDIINTANDIISFPSRIGQAANAIGAKAEDVVKTHAEALGLHPAIAWALSKAAGMVANPLNYGMFGEGSPTLKGEDFPSIGNVGGEKTIARAAQAERMGVTLSPAEASQTKILNVLEDLGNIYPYTGDDFQNFYQTRLSQADAIRQKLMDSVGNNAATKKVADMMKSTISDYLENATPEHAAYLADRMGDLETYMKKPAAGEFSQSMLAQQRKIALDAAGAPFDALRSIVPDETPVPTPTFIDKAKEFLKQEMQGKVSDRNPAWMKRLADYAGVDTSGLPTMADGTPISGPLYDAIQNELEKQGGQKAGQMPFAGTQMTMRKLRDLRISNDPGYLLGIKGQGNTYAGYAAELRGALSDDIDSGLSKLSDQASQALKEAPPTDPAIADHLDKMTNVSEMYQAAKKNYAQTKELMNDPFIIKLLKNNPEDFLNHAVKPQDITNISKLKEILGPDNFVPVQQNLLANMLVDKSGELNPKSFVNKVDKIGFPTLTTVFDPKTMYEIGQAQEVFSAMKRGFAEGSQTGGRLMAKAALFGIPAQAFHLVMSGEPMAAAGVLAGGIGIPKALARFYLSDTGREMLIKGMVMPDSAAMVLSTLGKAAMMSGLENAKSSTGQ